MRVEADSPRDGIASTPPLIRHSSVTAAVFSGLQFEIRTAWKGQGTVVSEIHLDTILAYKQPFRPDFFPWLVPCFRPVIY